MSGLNLWECQHPDCDRTVVGVHGAVGLRAIGWYFKRGPIIFCPSHRPDTSGLFSAWLGCDGKSGLGGCPVCKAYQEASIYQRVIESLEVSA